MSTQALAPNTVFIVDDEETTRRQVEVLLAADGTHSRTFCSLVRFLEWLDYDRLPGNTVIAAEISQPELSGLDLLNILRADDVFVPTILMGKSMSVSDAVEAMYAGANFILQKPFSDNAFRAAIHRSVTAGRTTLRPTHGKRSIRRRLSSLSQRQRQLMIHVSHGRTNREIAALLSISRKTVELHRAAMMQKMGARSLAELVRIAIECDELTETGVRHEWA